jgi:hypothetical protein
MSLISKTSPQPMSGLETKKSKNEKTGRFMSSEEPRTTALTLRVSAYERALIAECAKNEWMTVSEFMRWAALRFIRQTNADRS